MQLKITACIDTPDREQNYKSASKQHNRPIISVGQQTLSFLLSSLFWDNKISNVISIIYAINRQKVNSAKQLYECVP